MSAQHTKAEWREMAVEFRAARRRIANMEFTYICHALGGRLSNSNPYPRAVRLAKDLVMGRLAPYGTYVSWLANNHQSTFDYAFVLDKYSPFLEGRLAWLDSLIAECEQKGRP